MNDATSPRASRWRWVWGFVFLFLAHAALVFWLAERARPVPVAERLQPLIYLPADDAAMSRATELAARSDPTLFSLPNTRGFSGDAWLSLTPEDMTLSNWSAPPSWLPLPTNELGAMMVRYAATNRVSSDELLEHLRALPPFELRVPARPISTGSTFLVEGPLKSRAGKLPGRLPSVPSLDLVTNTVVEVAVNGDGVVESALLLGECGIKSVDEQAVSLARGLLFSPARPPRTPRDAAGLQRSRVVFTWHTVSPALTKGLTTQNP